jgi:hypothetical protein
MKTTLNIHDALLAEAKVVAAQQRVTLTRLIEEGLRLRIRTAQKSPKTKLRPMPTFKGGKGLAAGLVGNSTRELLDTADRAD